ncbi:MAG: hypothetical protein HYV07_32630 [Deltaproteobacteria bacterium]|nr:hypothetical protein [Deltaproteobacteria bacterium]
MISVALLAVLTAAPEEPETVGDPEEGPRLVMPGGEDLSKVDKSPDELRAEAEASDAARLAAWIEVAGEAGALQIARGDARFLTVEIPLKRRPTSGTAFWRVLPEAQEGATLGPWVEHVTFLEDKRRVIARGRVAILVDAASRSKARVVARLEAREKESWSVLGEARVAFTVDVKPATATEQDIDDARRAHGIFVARARAALERLPELTAYLRLDSMDPPPASTNADSLPSVEAFLAARLRAAIAEGRLRAAAELPDPELAERAVLALGSLRRGDADPLETAAAEKRSNAENLAIARRRVDALSLDSAETLLSKLRKRGQLVRGELEEALILLGCIHAARGMEDRAKKAFGQALCLNPNAKLSTTRVPMVRAFESVRAQAPCPEGINPGEPFAVLVTESGGTYLDVTLPFGPDPHELVSGGDVEVFGPGGDVMLKASTRAEHGKLVARFGLTDSIAADIRARVLVRAVAKETSGVAIFTLGAEEPKSVPVERVEAPSTVSRIPWWVWVAGGAGVVGVTAVVIAAASSGGAPSRTIGPVGITF